MEHIKVSVIMGIYNCDKYLDDSINSILNQTYENIELIMCDDGSIDNTLNIAKKYEKEYPQKIKVIQNEKNMGLNYTLNNCLKHANGQYIARQDGDDVSVPDRIEKQVRFLEDNPQYAIVSSNVELFDENGKWGNGKIIEEPQKLDFYKGSPFCHAASMTRKEAFDEVGGYTVEKKLLRVEDYHLWYKMYQKGYKGYNLQEVLYKIRDNKEAFKRRSFKSSINECRLRWRIFRDFKIPYTKYLYIIRPIIVSLIPRKVYKLLHKQKYKEEMI